MRRKKMNTSIKFTSVLKLILLLAAVGVLPACSAFGTATPVNADPPATATLPPAAPTTATLRGTVGYQGPAAPASVLYIVGSQHWYAVEVPAGNPATFEQQVAPDTYQLIAYPAGSQADENRGAAAYSTGDGIASLSVDAGQVVDGIQVRNINSDLCISIPFPASPDGIYPAIPETCSQLTPAAPVTATLRGTVGYQGPSAPASSLYIIGTTQWYLVNVPAGSPATFEQAVAPGTYQLIAYPVGSQSASSRSAAAYATGSGIGSLTVSAGEQVNDIPVRNINSDLCISIPFPASPDGAYPAIPETCSQLTPVAPAMATLRGTVGYQSPVAPDSVLYIIGTDRWYSIEVPAGFPATFEKQVVPGTYQLIAFPAGSQNQEYRPSAAYSTGNGIADLTVSAGQVVDGIAVKNINPDNCVLYSFPPSPDGVFAAIPQSCDQ
jgi:hypothetical protein